MKLIVTFICVCASFLTAPHPSNAKAIDLSNVTDPTGVYNVAFCARPSPDSSGKPGHAFVAYSHARPNGDRDFVAMGHTIGAGVGPISASWSYFGSPVSGLLKEERYTSIKQNCLDVTVNKVDFDRARALAEDPLFKLGLTVQPGTVFQAYKLGLDDCMTFLIAVAETLKSKGLKVPPRGATELPMAYIIRFIAAN